MNQKKWSHLRILGLLVSISLVAFLVLRCGSDAAPIGNTSVDVKTVGRIMGLYQIETAIGKEYEKYEYFVLEPGFPELAPEYAVRTEPDSRLKPESMLLGTALDENLASGGMPIFIGFKRYETEKTTYSYEEKSDKVFIYANDKGDRAGNRKLLELRKVKSSDLPAHLTGAVSLVEELSKFHKALSAKNIKFKRDYGASHGLWSVKGPITPESVELLTQINNSMDAFLSYLTKFKIQEVRAYRNYDVKASPYDSPERVGISPDKNKFVLNLSVPQDVAAIIKDLKDQKEIR